MSAVQAVVAASEILDAACAVVRKSPVGQVVK